jgi:hypothetical protein
MLFWQKKNKNKTFFFSKEETKVSPLHFEPKKLNKKLLREKVNPMLQGKKFILFLKNIHPLFIFLTFS